MLPLLVTLLYEVWQQRTKIKLVQSFFAFSPIGQRKTYSFNNYKVFAVDHEISPGQVRQSHLPQELIIILVLTVEPVHTRSILGHVETWGIWGGAKPHGVRAFNLNHAMRGGLGWVKDKPVRRRS